MKLKSQQIYFCVKNGMPQENVLNTTGKEPGRGRADSLHQIFFVLSLYVGDIYSVYPLDLSKYPTEHFNFIVSILHFFSFNDCNKLAVPLFGPM